MKWVLRLIAATVIVMSGIAAFAESDCADRVTVRDVMGQDGFDALIGWIALHTDYDVTRSYYDPPAVSFCDVGETVPYEGRELIVEDMLNAAFDLEARNIYLVRPWSADDVYDRSVLLHELIHDVQLLNRDWPCIGKPELEAYLLQDRWLKERGIRVRFNWAEIIRLSRCPEE
ncbi:DUF6647 family protein [Marimonas lutisalis]|uniref:DUF6647 family protein n=1 Tax=Marimonas lutisalis TaxID=2545756 RepID=UPI0010F61C6F|nr:DUF6647 family protein [Marimonas lutisalis]